MQLNIINQFLVSVRLSAVQAPPGLEKT